VRDGVNVTVGLGEDLNVDSARYKDIGFIKLPLIRRGGIRGFAKSIIDTSRLLRASNYDVVVVHTPAAAFLIRWAIFPYLKLKVIYTVHGFYFHEYMPALNKVVHICSEFVLSFRTSQFIFVSQEDFHFMKNLLFFRPASDFHLVPNKVDAPRFMFDDSNRSKFRSRLEIDSATVVFGMVCRINPEKGVEEFLRAAVEISKNHNSCYFLIVGDIFREEVSVEFAKLVETSKISLSDRIHITGFTDDVGGFLSAIDCFCLPSYREGYPVSYIEALVSGCHCIVSNIRGCREITEVASDSVVVEPRNVASLRNAMLSFMLGSRPRLSQRLAKSVAMAHKFGLRAGLSGQNVVIRKFLAKVP
jgi:glycosyltransferase involved in cell wall biosynthesis